MFSASVLGWRSFHFFCIEGDVRQPHEIKAACAETVSPHLSTKYHHLEVARKMTPTPHATVPILFVVLVRFLCFPEAPDVRNKSTTPKFGVPWLFQSGGDGRRPETLDYATCRPKGNTMATTSRVKRKSGGRAPPLLAIFPLALKWPPLYCPLVRPRFQHNVYNRVFL